MQRKCHEARRFWRGRSHASKPRNKLIAQVFYDLEIIERYGSGIHRMLDACAAARLSEPSLAESTRGFLMRFRKAAGESSDTGQAGTRSGEQVGEEVSAQGPAQGATLLARLEEEFAVATGQVTGQVTGQDAGQDTINR